MRFTIVSIFLCMSLHLQAQSWVIQTMPSLPEPITNNAVCEGYLGDTTFIFTFGGLDSTKLYSGIHQRGYRYNDISMQWQPIPDLPDTLGKIATSASRVNDTIYIIGGYHVLGSGTEISSNKVHRYCISTNSFLSDGTNIPLAIDDHVQSVWNDSLIFCITGWSNSGNTNKVQIYNPYTDSWFEGTPVPNSNYRLFGAGGTIIGNIIYYFGGAKNGINFPAGNRLFIGEIDPINPANITWTDLPLGSNYGYRCAGTSVNNHPYFIGGSNTTYNYNGIAYNGSGGVDPHHQVLEFIPSNNNYYLENYLQIPMDLRNIANASDSVKYIAGGMLENQSVTNQFIKLSRKNTTGLDNTVSSWNGIQLYPNPASDKLFYDTNAEVWKIDIINTQGQLIMTSITIGDYINITKLTAATYYIIFHTTKGVFSSSFIKG